MRLITLERARGLHKAIKARWNLGQPEGYGIVVSYTGEELSGSTYRTPKGLYCFDVRKTPKRTLIGFSRHPAGVLEKRLEA